VKPSSNLYVSSLLSSSYSLIMGTERLLFPPSPTRPVTRAENDSRPSPGFFSLRTRSLPSNGSTISEHYARSRLHGSTATRPKRCTGSRRRSRSSLPPRCSSCSARACRSKSLQPRPISRTVSQLSPTTSSRARPSTTRIYGSTTSRSSRSWRGSCARTTCPRPSYGSRRRSSWPWSSGARRTALARPRRNPKSS
jgi:hypothetical protein